ncbi:hypothetical protein OIDMADRAFT_104493 [Oidiodendron maius Zn]|uniref:Transcription factor domain-containing protein n=1 Tax=Oidiodendron maius (strain Zn) TaxID=913774 RepID=A0A0C3DFP7_OIDMZ|nr:hypothetical protein OIDMADRAFT_104493 [Oidiodendron maius Zn]
MWAGESTDTPHDNRSRVQALNYKYEPPGEDFESSRSMSMLEVDAFQHQALDSTFLTSDERIGHIFSTSFLSFTTPALRPGIDQQNLSLLPSRKEAIFLVEFYMKNIIPFYYIIHVPTVSCMLDTVYTKLENNQQPQHDQVALLSTIIALGAYFAPASSRSHFNDPKHMQVELPTNVDDIDINSSGVYGRPLESVPTDMTYCLIRAKLSVSIREIVDSANNTGCSPDSLPYDVVLLFDKKINESIIDFARVTSRYDAKDHLEHKEVDNPFHKPPLLSLMAEFCPQTKLIRLHRPYLARGARDPKYAYSRMMCLRSARCVIELGMKIMDSDEEFAPNRMWTIVYHFFVSVLVLVMDYSLNRKEPREDERKAEILDCFKWLEANQESSMLAKRALRQLRELLSKGVVKGDPGGKGNPPLIQTDAGLARLNSQNSHIQQGDAQSLLEPSVVQQEDADPFAQYNGSSTDFTLMDNLDFNVDLDESQFETFFNHIEGSQSMHRAL